MIYNCRQLIIFSDNDLNIQDTIHVACEVLICKLKQNKTKNI